MALSGKERQRRYMARLKKRANVPTLSTHDPEGVHKFLVGNLVGHLRKASHYIMLAERIQTAIEAQRKELKV